MLGKIVLWFTAAMFIVYGVVCFFSPELPANYAGLVIASGDGYAEVTTDNTGWLLKAQNL